jgi:hypothetical protein
MQNHVPIQLLIQFGPATAAAGDHNSYNPIIWFRNVAQTATVTLSGTGGTGTI